MKRFEKMEDYPDDIRGRFNSFITTQFDDSLSVEMQIRSIIKWAIDNFKEMDQTYNAFTEYLIEGNLNPFIEFLNDLIEYMNEFIDTFDVRYQETILDKMQEWYNNGELETLINESLDTQYRVMDQRLTNRLNQLAQTNIALENEKADRTELGVERDRINNLVANAGDTDGNAELLDIRVSVDGTVYETAGEAVRNVLTPYMYEENEGWAI